MNIHYEIWNIASLAWTEIGADESDFNRATEILLENDVKWNEVDKIIFRDVCGSFSVMSATFLVALIPIIGLLMITPMPDWGYEEEYLRKRIAKWESVPILLHFLNPVRIIGYPIALIFVIRLRFKLKKAYEKKKCT